MYQANTTAGFSIVQYETNSGTSGSSQTVAHGLSQAPNFMILKSRDQDGTGWMVYYGDNTDYVVLNATNTKVDGQSTWNDTSPTSSVFSIGTNGGDTNNTNGGSMIGYIFHDVEGYSRFGMYDANGNDDGTFVFLGFRPAFVMLKNIDNNTNGGNWVIMDDTRGGVGANRRPNPILSQIKANSSDAEFDSISYPMADFLSNGFKLRLGGTNSGLSRNVNNANGNDYIYMAFAHSPFKYANAF